MIFKGFDYGKGLMRQVDSYRRLTLLQQGKRHPVLVKALEAYIKKFMAVLENPGSGNPGQLKNAAEVMVESAIALQDTELAFAAFADMASRSRKVPVVPGLAGLVDRLLESPDEHKKYRVVLYNWRITAGSLRPERKLKYLTERARLTQSTDHWRDYAAGWMQIIEKKGLERGDKLILEAMDDLHQNRKMTGDLITSVQLLCVEILLENGKARQAEELLFELVADNKDIYQLPRQFFTLIGDLVAKRPDAGWELHQIVLDVAILDYAAGRHGFSVLEKLIQREQGKPDQLLQYLLNHEAMVKDKRLSVITLARIFNSANLDPKPYLQRWHEAYGHAGLDRPAELLALIEQAELDGRVDAEPLLRSLSNEPVPELSRQVQIRDDQRATVEPNQDSEEEPEPTEDAVELTGEAVDDGPDSDVDPVEENWEEETDDDELGGGIMILEPAVSAAVDPHPLTEPGVSEEEMPSATPVAAEEPAGSGLEPGLEAGVLEPEASVEAHAASPDDSYLEDATASDVEETAESAVATPEADDQEQAASSEDEVDDLELAEILAEIHSTPTLSADSALEATEEQLAEASAAWPETPVDGTDEATDEVEPMAACHEAEVLGEDQVPESTETGPALDLENAMPGVLAAGAGEAGPAEVALPELAVPVLLGLAGAPQVWNALDHWLEGREINDGLIQLELALIEDGVAESTIVDARLWLIERLLAAGLRAQAEEQIGQLAIPDITEAGKLLDRLLVLLGEDPLVAALPLISQLALAAGRSSEAFNAAVALPLAHPARTALLEALDEWIVSQPEPAPALLMVLAKTQRALRDDPQAGFAPATTASLLAAHDAQLQGDYAGWVIALAPEVVHYERARQGAFLTAREARHELLPVALDEIEALASVLPTPPPRELLEWLEELRAVVDAITPNNQQQDLLLRWTKLYLNLAAQIGEQERLQQVLSTAAELIAPEAAYTLVTELGHNLPQATRLRLECSALVRQGQWQQALDLALDPSSTPPEAVPLATFCAELPDEALLPAGTRLAQYYTSQDDSAGQLELIQQLQARFGNGGVHTSEAEGLRGFLDQQLQALCERSYIPAVRYRLALTQDVDTAGRARDLLALAGLDDQAAVLELTELFPRLLELGSQPGLVMQVGELLARRQAGVDADAALTLAAQAGLSIDAVDWALALIRELGLKATGLEPLELLGELALRQHDPGQALDIAEQLLAQEAALTARPLIEEAVKQLPEQPRALALQFNLLLQADCRDLPKATSLLLKLAQLYQHGGQDAAGQLAPLGWQIEAALLDTPDSDEARYLKLAYAALTGNQKQAALLVQQIMQSGGGSSARLLALFEQLALEDAELPAPLVIAWGQALFDVGRLADALARLAGLRDAVGNYPEYIALLEEIKEHGGGPGASMQLGEAYLRVHLWQRSAEEYAAALTEDPALAEPILTQLRHHGALDPNPMKYPLHVLGLRAVACSVRTADWGWALSALAWLKGRWSAEELFERAVALWDVQGQVELAPEHRLELLLVLQSLAASIGELSAALDYLDQAWQDAASPNPQLLGALAEYDEQRLPDTPDIRFKLARLHFKAAQASRKLDALLVAAQKLTAFGEEGRTVALAGLDAFREHAADPLAITVARLKLHDLHTREGAQAFLADVHSLALEQLPREQAFALVQSAVELVPTLSGDAELAKLLLELFAQLGDYARVWQLGLNLFLDPVLGADAVQALEATAADEFAVQQQVALVEVHLRRSDYGAVAKALTRLGWGNIAVFGPQAEALAEALLATPAASEARRWLIAWYRERHEDALAADHVVWAHATGDQQPAGWIEDARGADLLYRSAMLRELAGDLPAARRVLERARKAGASDSAIQAAICLRLSEFAQGDGNLVLACDLAREATASLPGEVALSQRVASLERQQVEEKITAALQREDSPERTLEVARLYRQLQDYAQAVNELQNGLGRGQSQPALFIELAECFIERGDLNLARRAFNEVLRRLEQVHDVEASLRARYGLAQTEERLSNPDEAIRNLEQILVMRQNYRDSREWLNRLYGKEPKQPGKSAKDSILSEIFNLLGQSHDNPPPDKEQ